MPFLSKFLFYFFCYLVFFAPIIYINGIQINFIYLTIIFSLSLFFFCFIQLKYNYKIYLPFLILFFTSLFNFICFDFRDSSFLILSALSLLLLPLSLNFNYISSLFGIKDSYFFVSRLITLNALFVLLSFLFFSIIIESSLINFFPNMYIKGLDDQYINRPNGISNIGGATLSVIFAFNIILINYRFNKSNYFINLLNFIAILLTGRTGIVLLLIYFVFRYFRVLLKPKILFIIAGILFFILFSTSYYQYLLEFDPNLALSFYRAFEPIIKFYLSGEFSTSSTDTLINDMLFLPDNSIFGNGNFGRAFNLLYLESDIGFIRVISGGGFILLFFYLLPLFSLLFKTFSKISIFVVFALILLNFKEFFYFDFPILSLLIFTLTNNKCNHTNQLI